MMKTLNCIQRWLVLWAIIQHAILLPLYADSTVAGSVGKVTQTAGTIFNTASEIIDPNSNVGKNIAKGTQVFNALNSGLSGNQINSGQGMICTPPNQTAINQLAKIKAQCDALKNSASLNDIESSADLWNKAQQTSNQASPANYLSCLQSKMEASIGPLTTFYTEFQNSIQSMKNSFAEQLKQQNYLKLVEDYKNSYDLLFGAVWKDKLLPELNYCKNFMEESESNGGLHGLLNKGTTYQKKIKDAETFSKNKLIYAQGLHRASSIVRNINFNDQNSMTSLIKSLPDVFSNGLEELERNFNQVVTRKKSLLDQLEHETGKANLGDLDQVGNNKEAIRRWADKSTAQCIHQKIGNINGILSQVRGNPKATKEVNAVIPVLLKGIFEKENLLGFLERHQGQLKKYQINTREKKIKKNIYQYFKEQYDNCLQESIIDGGDKSREEIIQMAKKTEKEIESLQLNASKEFQNNFNQLLMECESPDGAAIEYNSKNCFSSNNNWCFKRENNCSVSLTSCDRSLRKVQQYHTEKANFAAKTAQTIGETMANTMDNFLILQRKNYGTLITSMNRQFGLKLTQIKLPEISQISDMNEINLKNRQGQDGVTGFIDLVKLSTLYTKNLDDFAESLEQQIIKIQQNNASELQKQQQNFSGINKIIGETLESCQVANKAGQKNLAALEQSCEDLKEINASLCSTTTEGESSTQNPNSILFEVLKMTSSGKKIPQLCNRIILIEKKIERDPCSNLDGSISLIFKGIDIDGDPDCNPNQTGICCTEKKSLNECCSERNDKNKQCGSNAVNYASCIEEEVFSNINNEENVENISIDCRSVYKQLGLQEASSNPSNKNNKGQRGKGN